MNQPSVPEIRVQALNDAPPNRNGEYVLYWMIAARRPRANFGLQRAIELARRHGAGLIVLEALRCDYPWASERLHAFILQGMIDNAQAFAPARYYPYIEHATDAGKGLLRALAQRAVAVVTDQFPCFFLPRMLQAARIDVRFEQADSNGLLPLRAAERDFSVAHSFRRFLQKQLKPHLAQPPASEPLRSLRLPEVDVPADVLRRWPRAEPEHALARLSELPVDHGVKPVATRGGWRAANARLADWLESGYPHYAAGRNDPDAPGPSGLSPWLHFGHISPWEILDALAGREGWSPDRIRSQADGRRGWWGMSANGEAFLDELVTWRELGYQYCHRHADYAEFNTLPDFALKTLRKHAADARPYLYKLGQWEEARTHDELWNAAQRQLVREGRIHNYLRMLWGKCILHWSATPQEALQTMIHLNNKYALDGRNPNSYSGIMWCLGRFDRAWGPERPVFGKVRYMTSRSARGKLKLKEYLKRFGSGEER
jgi:deoxyribodipyrimidine photo-lyase